MDSSEMFMAKQLSSKSAVIHDDKLTKLSSENSKLKLENERLLAAMNEKEKNFSYKFGELDRRLQDAIAKINRLEKEKQEAAVKISQLEKDNAQQSKQENVANDDKRPSDHQTGTPGQIKQHYKPSPAATNKQLATGQPQQSSSSSPASSASASPRLSRSKDGYEAWFDTAKYGKLGQLEMLLDQGVDCNAKNKDDPDQWSALHYCAQRGFNEMAQVLLKKGARVDEKNKRSETPLMIACRNGKMELIKVLLEHGADVNAKDSHGKTPLIWAAWNGEDEAVKILVDEPHLNSLNHKDKDNNSALQCALKRPSLFLDAQAAANYSQKCDAVVAILKSKGAKV